MMRFALGLSLIFALTVPVQAEPCQGKNLIAALPPADLAALQVQADGPYDHGNFWQARKDGKVITLVGTYHLSDPRFDPILATLMPHLAQAKTLLVEAGPTEQAALQNAVLRDPSLMYITTGPILPEQMPPKDWAQIALAADARGLAPYAAATMQPWLLASVLERPTCLFPVQAGADQGLDKRLIDAALANNIPIVALEPFDAILKIFAQIPPADQIAMLRQTVAMDAQSDDMATTLSDSYFAGDSRLFWAYMGQVLKGLPDMTQAEADREMALIDQAMISSRNVAWVPVLEQAAQNGPVMAAFGALHLPGDAGVLALLAQNGWTVQAFVP
jgi:hypothetical protein